MMDDTQLDQMVYAYLDAAIWAGLDWSRCDRWDEDDHGVCTEECVGGGNPAPLDANYDYDDVAEETLISVAEECQAFFEANKDDLAKIDAEQAGHDFYLTRNRHGAGFWGRGLGDVGERLYNAARVYGESELHTGDDDKLYA